MVGIIKKNTKFKDIIMKDLFKSFCATILFFLIILSIGYCAYNYTISFIGVAIFIFAWIKIYEYFFDN